MDIEEYREITRIFKLTKEALIKELIELKFGIENEEPVKGEKAGDIPWI